MKDITCCIWDFNGTVLDDVDAGIGAVNKLLAERGLPVIKSREDYYSHFRFPIIEYYRSLGFDFSVEPYEDIAPLWVAEYLNNVKHSCLCDGVLEALERFRSNGVKQVIISATELKMLKKQLSDLGIEQYFDQVWGLDNIHAASKVELARRWREENPEERAVFLGDTVHDAEAARAIGVECFLIASGHQSRKTLESVGVPVFDNVLELYGNLR